MPNVQRTHSGCECGEVETTKISRCYKEMGCNIKMG